MAVVWGLVVLAACEMVVNVWAALRVSALPARLGTPDFREEQKCQGIFLIYELVEENILDKSRLGFECCLRHHLFHRHGTIWRIML
ncbi:MAG: hypothetical protein HFG08_09045 [Oscillibacter sp.]|nr:hypothetical protein [Oscillibacter sp.]